MPACYRLWLGLLACALTHSGILTNLFLSSDIRTQNFFLRSDPENPAMSARVSVWFVTVSLRGNGELKGVGARRGNGKI